MAIPDAGWFYVDSAGFRQGPMDRASLISMRSSGQISDSSLVWAKGMAEWAAFASVFELDTPPPVPSSAIPPPQHGADAGRDNHERLMKLRGTTRSAHPMPEDNPQPSVSPDVSSHPMSRGVYVGLCFFSWLVGVIAANVISPLLGSAYAEATIAVVIAFWCAKYFAKDSHRGWSSIAMLPIITVASGLLGASLGTVLSAQAPEGPKPTALVALAVAFVLSYAFFSVRKRFGMANRIPQ
jgi:hypothetical protein